MNNKVNQTIDGEGNSQYNAKKIILKNYISAANQASNDQGVIDDIFKFVIENVNNRQLYFKSRPEKLLKMEKKIIRNFKTANERAEIREYARLAFDKISLIDRAFTRLEPCEQSDIHSYIFSRYIENKKLGMDNSQNFYALYKHFIPESRINNPQYEHIAKSFVLFFFQDCTIFEKTREEMKQLKLSL